MLLCHKNKIQYRMWGNRRFVGLQEHVHSHLLAASHKNLPVSQINRSRHGKRRQSDAVTPNPNSQSHPAHNNPLILKCAWCISSDVASWRFPLHQSGSLTHSSLHHQQKQNQFPKSTTTSSLFLFFFPSK